MERLIDWHFRTHTLVERLKAAGQCAYLRGASTEMALHAVVVEAERALQYREFALCVMMNIEGAFSRATFRSMIGAMRKHGLPENLVRWVEFMLCNRTVCTTLQGVFRERVVEKGCPQGNVLTPLLWILLIHELLMILIKRCLHLMSRAFAGAVSLLQRGLDLGTITQLVQRGLHIISEWCAEVDLAVLANSHALHKQDETHPGNATSVGCSDTNGKDRKIPRSNPA